MSTSLTHTTLQVTADRWLLAILVALGIDEPISIECLNLIDAFIHYNDDDVASVIRTTDDHVYRTSGEHVCHLSMNADGTIEFVEELYDDFARELEAYLASGRSAWPLEPSTETAVLTVTVGGYLAGYVPEGAKWSFAHAMSLHAWGLEIEGIKHSGYPTTLLQKCTWSEEDKVNIYTCRAEDSCFDFSVTKMDRALLAEVATVMDE